MPSPTRKAKSPPPLEMLPANLMAEMMAGKVAWGNLINTAAPKNTRKAKRGSSSPKAAVWNIEAEALEDYKVPDLRLRKAIWETFPVDLKAIDSRDGTERYAIVWNQKKLKEWRETRAESLDEYMDYADYQAARLLYALKHHPSIYRLEPARNATEFAVIAMVHHGRRTSPKGPVGGAGRSRSRSRSPSRHPALPVLRRLTDIRDAFPDVVVWKSVEGRRGESTYALTVMGKFLRAVPRDVADRVLGDLMLALRASPSWHVLRPVGDEFARLEMKHD